MQQAAFDRGSFASLLGVSDRGDGRVGVLAIGDSLAVLCDGDRVVASFPYELPEQFEARPQLLSTNPAENAFLAEPDALPGCRSNGTWGRSTTRRCSASPTRSAAGSCRSATASRRRSLGCAPSRNRAAFARFVEEERAAGRMRRDDTTLLAYWHWSAEPAGKAPPC